MGKIGQGILGGFSGKVGNVVGARWKGIDYMRVKADRRNDANTEGQIAQRSRFSGILRFAQSVLNPIVRPIWEVAAKGLQMTGFNLFIKDNMEAFDAEGNVIDFGQLQMSKGDLAPAKLAIASTDGVEKSVTVSWPDNTGQGQSNANDRLRLLAVKEGKIPVLLNTSFERSAGTGDYVIPFETGDEIHVYAFFENADGDQFSVDTYQAVVLG